MLLCYIVVVDIRYGDMVVASIYMYMYLRDLDGRRVAWRPDSLVSQVSRFSEYGHGVHYFHHTVSWQLSCGHEQSLGTRQFGPLAAKWAWPCTAKC